MRTILLLITLYVTLFSSQLKAADALPEYTLKAAYLYNFALLTDWPQEKQTGSFKLCLYGQNTFGSALNALNSKKIGEQAMQTAITSSLDEVKKCHIVFFGGNDTTKEQKMIDEIAGFPVLIVTDNPHIARYHIAIIQDNERLSFTINTKALKEAGLNLSSRLLSLAKKIQ